MTGIARGRKYGPCPGAWKIKDPIKHQYYRAYSFHKAQAKFRNEDYNLTFDDWYNIWGNKIDYRGRTKDSYCLTRKDKSIGWTIFNTKVIVRNNGNNGKDYEC